MTNKIAENSYIYWMLVFLSDILIVTGSLLVALSIRFDFMWSSSYRKITLIG